jgi:predicted RecA/RadA family phage recombinase
MKNRVGDAGRIEHTNSGQAAIASGEVVDLDTQVGIAVSEIAVDEVGILELTGRFRLPKDTNLVIALGDMVYWDAINGWVDKTSTAQTYVGKATKSATQTADEVEVEINTGGSFNTPAEIRSAVESAGLDADALEDGTTNHAFTALDDTKLAGAFIIGTNDADDVTDGTTNHAFTALDDTKLGFYPTKFKATSHTVTAGEASANQADIATAFAEAPDGWIVQIYRAGVDVKSDAIITALSGGDLGKIRVADGAATYAVTENDVINVLAWVD